MGNTACATCENPEGTASDPSGVRTNELTTGNVAPVDKEAAIISANEMVSAEQPPAVQTGVMEDKARDTSGADYMLQSLDILQGKWIRQVDGMVMGEISADKVVWDASYQHPPSPLTLLASGDIVMELAGVAHWGRYESGSASSLKWSDGEVWIMAQQ